MKWDTARRQRKPPMWFMVLKRGKKRETGNPQSRGSGDLWIPGPEVTVAVRLRLRDVERFVL